MSVLQQLHEAHKARRARLFATKPSTVIRVNKPAPQPEPEEVRESALERLMREVEALDAGEPANIVSTPTRLNVRHVAEIVADHYGYTVEGLRSPQRTAGIVLARQVAIYLAKSVTRRSLKEVGRRFHRDHTTVIHAVRKIEAQRAVDSLLDAELRLLSARLSERFVVPQVAA